MYINVTICNFIIKYTIVIVYKLFSKIRYITLTIKINNSLYL